MIKAIIFDCFGVLTADINVADLELFNFISAELKPKYKIGMLSNVGENWLHKIFSPEQLALFDSIALSYSIGVSKPDSQAYQIIAHRLGVQADECLFIDDLEQFCQGARDIGMRAIRYENFEQFRAEIHPLIASDIRKS